MFLWGGPAGTSMLVAGRITRTELPQADAALTWNVLKAVCPLAIMGLKSLVKIISEG